MHFVYPLPWWLAALLAAGIGGLSYVEYRRPLAPLTPRQRTGLAACRALVLAVIVAFLFRPVVFVPPQGASGAVVPVLVDRSRSMRLNDADGQPRLSRAMALLKGQLLPALSGHFTPELYSVGDRFEATAIDTMQADEGQSDLRGALAAVRERYRGQRVAGIVLLSDGGDTASSPSDLPSTGPPVFAVGLGSPDGVEDREVAGMTAGDQRLDQASIDLRVSAVSSGFGRAPFQLRVLANGAEIERRRIVPAADGAPIDEVFTVSPDPAMPTVYTAEIPADRSESIVENNRRSVLVNPAGRRRRLLMIEGAPGFEHSFMKRAWLRDPGLDVDAVGRKGKNAEGQDTFFVQAAATRTAALTHGFPERREDLYAYDALVIANVDGDFFTRAQLTMAAEFVSERGGGLLIVGTRSFLPRGLSGTPLEDVLPVELSDRRGGLVRTSVTSDRAASNKVVVTAEGEGHPVMRIGDTPGDTRRLWAALPALAWSVPLGAPKPGASVLAVTSSSAGSLYPIVAVQRYGRGRSMTFSGEASWRWKMLLPSTDRSFEYFWRQAARWVAGPTPGPVDITIPDSASPGDVPVVVDVRDAQFAAVGDAIVTGDVTSPGGESGRVQWRPEGNGRYSGTVRAAMPGLYHVTLEARRGNTVLGAAARWMEVGGVDREFVDPRLNEAWLRRVARASGGRYVRPSDASNIVNWLQETSPQQAAPERRDLWHEPLAFALIIALLSAEWVLRRRWGLR
jgi:uncharacterized membrane protein